MLPENLPATLEPAHRNIDSKVTRWSNMENSRRNSGRYQKSNIFLVEVKFAPISSIPVYRQVYCIVRVQQ